MGVASPITGTRQSIFYIGNHKGLAIGNGIVFYVFQLLPVIGWVLAPAYAVVAATMSLHELNKSSSEKSINIFSQVEEYK